MLLISETEKKIVTLCPIAYQALFIWGENLTSKTGIANFYGDLCVGYRPVVSINWRSESYCRHSAAHVLPNSAFMRFQRLNSSAQSHFYQIEKNVQIFTDHDNCQRIITQLSVLFTWLQNKMNIYQEVLLIYVVLKWSDINSCDIADDIFVWMRHLTSMSSDLLFPVSSVGSQVITEICFSPLHSVSLEKCSLMLLVGLFWRSNKIYQNLCRIPPKSQNCVAIAIM